MKQADIGVIGLSVMGANLAQNFESHGYTVAVYNRTANKTDAFIADHPASNFLPATALNDFVNSLASPRKILMMVKAGQAVDELIDQLLPLISEGDVLIDGGNSYFPDTARRVTTVESAGKLFVGMGVSGGEEGALHGPALMPGGSQAAWPIIQPMLQAIAAKVISNQDGQSTEQPCVSWIGASGAGHFVKMVHNGIEYADMQLIAESYELLRKVLKLSPAEMAPIFQQWNQGPLKSYLIEITAQILHQKDPESSGYLVDHILDAAAQKGTGKWTSQVALDLAVAIPTISEAVTARFISSCPEDRAARSGVFPNQTSPFTGDQHQLIDQIEAALYSAKIVAYAQGFALLQAAALEYKWELDYQAIAASWRGGCIIRAELLNQIMLAFQTQSPTTNLITSSRFAPEIQDRYASWQEVLIQGIRSSLSLPGLTSAFTYYEALRTPQLPTNLIQAQRDFFGAHTYQRTDQLGSFHTDWQREKNES